MPNVKGNPEHHDPGYGIRVMTKMDFKVLLPTKVLIHEQALKINAEGANGAFCLLPRHVDFVSEIVPGILSMEKESNGKVEEVFMAVDSGVLVKRGSEVMVSSRNAVIGPELGVLLQTVRNKFGSLDDKEKKTRTAMANLEANFVRRFIELREHGS